MCVYAGNSCVPEVSIVQSVGSIMRSMGILVALLACYCFNKEWLQKRGSMLMMSMADWII